MRYKFQPLMVLATLLGIFLLSACNDKKKSDAPGPSAAPESAAPSELSLLIWPAYIDEKIIQDFEKQHNARLRMTIYDSTEEMESKLAYAGADAQYDVVVLASHAMPRLVRRGLLRPLDHSKIPNLKNVEPRFSGDSFDDGNKHAVPWQWGTVAIIYNKQKFPNLDPSWSVLFEPQKTVGTFVLIDEMRDMMGVALRYKGFSSNTTVAEEIREAGKLLKETKANPKCLGFRAGVGATQDVKGGSVDMAVVWNGDASKVVAEDKDRLGLIIPKEGSVIWVDVMAVTAKAPHADLAHKFIDFILQPEVGAQLSLFTKYASPNKASQAKLPAEERENPLIYPKGEISTRLEYHRDLGEAQKVYDEAWTAIKSN